MGVKVGPHGGSYTNDGTITGVSYGLEIFGGTSPESATNSSTSIQRSTEGINGISARSSAPGCRRA